MSFKLVLRHFQWMLAMQSFNFPARQLSLEASLANTAALRIWIPSITFFLPVIMPLGAKIRQGIAKGPETILRAFFASLRGLLCSQSANFISSEHQNESVCGLS